MYFLVEVYFFWIFWMNLFSYKNKFFFCLLVWIFFCVLVVCLKFLLKRFVVIFLRLEFINWKLLMKIRFFLSIKFMYFFILFGMMLIGIYFCLFFLFIVVCLFVMVLMFFMMKWLLYFCKLWKIIGIFLVILKFG